jgi:6-phosphogluconolactonase (cycloisomerase 2 family)
MYIERWDGLRFCPAMLAGKEFPMKKAITQAMTCLATAAFLATAVMMVPGATMAQSSVACAYANDDWASSGGNTVDGYLVSASSQTYLSPTLTGGESAGISSIADIVMSPVKKILYAADSQTGNVAIMAINPINCQLTLLGDYPAANPDRFGLGLAISADGKWLFVVGVKAAELRPFFIRKDGSLSAVHQKITLLDRPSSMAVSPDSTTLIVSVPQRPKHGNEVVSYSINPSNGMLTQVSMASPKGYAGSISIDSQSKFVYVQEGSSDHLRVGLLEIGSGSTLIFVHIYNFTEVQGGFPLSAAVLSSNGRYLYLTDAYISSINTLAVNSVTGALKYVATTNDGTMKDEPIGVATTKNGAFVFTGDFNSNDLPNMGIFAAGKRNGSLTSLGTFSIAEGENGAVPAWVVERTF